jgi:hypothetical protein
MAAFWISQCSLYCRSAMAMRISRCLEFIVVDGSCQIPVIRVWTVGVELLAAALLKY